MPARARRSSPSRCRCCTSWSQLIASFITRRLLRVTDRTLSDEERLRVWIYIHRQRREWDAKEKEMVAYRLVDIMGRASAANILGITVRELDKLVETFELSEKLTNLREPGASITWAEETAERDGVPDFVQMILDNLRKAGVQNTVKQERMVFTRLEPYAGRWIQATGEYTAQQGKPRRVAISIGPEHGTVGSQQIKEAAKEAVQGVGFDVLVVCGFAFDPHVSEEAKRYGNLTVLVTRMNPDLSMGDELLKKTGAGNLFMVFGEGLHRASGRLPGDRHAALRRLRPSPILRLRSDCPRSERPRLFRFPCGKETSHVVCRGASTSAHLPRAKQAPVRRD